jgi:hypothetical protein
MSSNLLKRYTEEKQTPPAPTSLKIKENGIKFSNFTQKIKTSVLAPFICNVK